MLEMYLASVLKLASGIQTIQAPQVTIDTEHAARYAVAASYHAQLRGLDPYELVGVARNESDFVENIRSPDGKDCGITQTRITVSHYKCKELRASYWLGFQEAARELSEY